MLTFRYIRKVCLSVGVPELWLDDCSQDVAFALWREGAVDNKAAARRRAIDFVRHYGAHTRYGADRTTLTLDHVKKQSWDSYLGLVRLDIRRAARSLTLKQRAALRRRMAGLPMTDVQSTHASAARRRLRKAMAA